MKSKIPPPVFVIDSREQLPFSFPNAIVEALPTADYSVQGFTDQIAVERKSLPDLAGCIGGERARFQRELLRLSQIQYRALVVEATLANTLSPAYRQLHPQAILGSLVAWSLKYQLPIWFASERDLAQQLTAKLLTKAYEYALNSKEAASE
jgi:DNA excision repair protein ERCC-4